MTIKRITNSSLEANRVILRPRVTYAVSGSDITGSIPLVPNPSNSIKVAGLHTPDSGPYAGQGIDLVEGLSRIKSRVENNIDVTGRVTEYLNDIVPNVSLPTKNNKQFDIVIENIPGINFLESSTNLPVSGSQGSLPSIVNSIIEKEIESNRNMDFGFTNYNCIGFVSGGYESSNAALIYKDETSTTDFRSFGVSFFVKPPDVTKSEFRPATVFHIDNLITVSLVSGSTQDRFGNTDSFKIVSQLSSSNENRVDDFLYGSIDSIPDNNSVYSNFEQQVVFTPKNEIKKGGWYHVAVTVDKSGLTQEKVVQKIFINGSQITGSVFEDSEVINGFNRSRKNSNNFENPHVVIGNKIENTADQDQFFIEKYEDYEKYSSTAGASEPSVAFESPFNGEVHEVVFATCQNENFPIVNFLNNRTETIVTSSLSPELKIDFYLPVLFGAVKNQKMRSYILKTTSPGLLTNPSDPFTANLSPHENPVISNDMRFPDVNITSFLGAFDFSQGSYNRVYPRCIGMESIDDLTSDENYHSGYQNGNSHEIASELSTFFSRNNLIRPCDNSNFNHDYEKYESILEDIGGTYLEKEERKFYLSSSLGNKDISHVSMKNYLNFTKGIGKEGSLTGNQFIVQNKSDNYTDFILYNSFPFFDKDIFNFYGFSWAPKLLAEASYKHSNLVSVIDIPQMFYDKKIHPGTFELIEHDLSGSLGMLTYNIKDNALGTLYRDNAAAPDQRNKCGLIFYELGIAVLTHPSLAMVGKNNFTVKFRGEKDLNVLNINAHVGKYEFNKSTNSSYNQIGKAGSGSSKEEIVMITGIEYLDENLNVVVKSNLSQPISKREFDEILFRSRIDF
jgi:hypothetical protein